MSRTDVENNKVIRRQHRAGDSTYIVYCIVIRVSEHQVTFDVSRKGNMS